MRRAASRAAQTATGVRMRPDLSNEAKRGRGALRLEIAPFWAEGVKTRIFCEKLQPDKLNTEDPIAPPNFPTQRHMD